MFFTPETVVLVALIQPLRVLRHNSAPGELGSSADVSAHGSEALGPHDQLVNHRGQSAGVLRGLTVHTYGTGLSAALLSAAVGHSPAYVWVLQDNPRTQAFYLKHGFRPGGERSLLPPEWEELPQLRTVRPVRSLR
jgi:hypothetical protein